MMNLTHWRLVVAVTDAGTISLGAERAGMTQSGASQAIAQLEKTLGASLFTRTRRSVVPTAFGDGVIENARAMLARFDDIRALADDQLGIESGRLRLGSFPSVIANQLPALLSRFYQRHPGIKIVLLEGTDEEVETWLADGTVDLGVVLNPEQSRQPVILGRDEWIALLPASYSLARRASAQGIELQELISQPYIHATGGCHVNGESLARERGLIFEDIRVAVRDWASACALVREGMGAAIVPESVLPIDKKGLRALPLIPSIARKFGLVTATSANNAAPLNIFWEHVVKSNKQRSGN